MGFEEARKKSLKDIIETEDLRDTWATTAFMKLVDAKTGFEIKQSIGVLIDSMGHIQNALNHSTDNLIESNKRLAEANNKYARALCWLTGGLVFIGVLPYIHNLYSFVVSLLKK